MDEIQYFDLQLIDNHVLATPHYVVAFIGNAHSTHKQLRRMLHDGDINNIASDSIAWLSCCACFSLRPSLSLDVSSYIHQYPPTQAIAAADRGCTQSTPTRVVVRV